MNTINPESWKADLPAFREKTAAFYAGEIKVGESRAFPATTAAMPRKAARPACCACVCPQAA